MKLNIKDSGGVTVLLIKILRKEDSEGWLQASCDFNYQGFKAHFSFSSMLNDFFPFYDQLQTLYQTLSGKAVYLNIERNIELTFLADGLGHILIKGELRHTNNPYLIISFQIDTDQTFLPEIIRECKEIIEQPRNYLK